MGVFTSFGNWWNGGSTAYAPTAIVSPWTTTQLNQVVIRDIFGEDFIPVTKADALSVPAVSKARGILHSLIDTRPLIAFRGAERLATQPTWLYRSDSGIPSQHRTSLMLDDHIFYDSTLLAITARGSDGFPINLEHVPFERWSRTNTGDIQIDQQDVDQDDMVWIPSPWQGLLNVGASKIRESRSLDQAAMTRARMPVPVMNVALNDDNLTEDEMRELHATISKARRDPDGALIITPPGATLNVFGDRATDYFESGRNAVRIDFANYFNLPASLLDSGISSSSLDYSTQEGKRNEIFDYAITYWTKEITSWLSMDKVTPRGTSIRFDFTDLITTTQSGTGPVTED
jgi:hypothetical protein